MSEFTLKSASIINGAQTVGSIIDVLNVEDLAKYQSAPILVRILEVKDYKERIIDVVNSLNTQTKMFSAYEISHDIRLEELQTRINNETEYFLEIKGNEFLNLKSNPTFTKLKKNLITSEKLVQYYVGYTDLKGKSFQSKLSISNILDDSELINSVLDNIEFEEFMDIFESYKIIQNIITLFRSYRKTENKEILEILNIEESEINKYQFLNTGDIITLFGLRHKLDMEPSILKEDAIISTIHIISELIEEINTNERPALSNLTKSKDFYTSVERRIRN